MAMYKVCTECGATLDPGERCDCAWSREGYGLFVDRSHGSPVGGGLGSSWGNNRREVPESPAGGGLGSSLRRNKRGEAPEGPGGGELGSSLRRNKRGEAPSQVRRARLSAARIYRAQKEWEYA